MAAICRGVTRAFDDSPEWLARRKPSQSVSGRRFRNQRLNDSAPSANSFASPSRWRAAAWPISSATMLLECSSASLTTSTNAKPLTLTIGRASRGAVPAWGSGSVSPSIRERRRNTRAVRSPGRLTGRNSAPTPGAEGDNSQRISVPGAVPGTTPGTKLYPGPGSAALSPGRALPRVGVSKACTTPGSPPGSPAGSQLNNVWLKSSDKAPRPGL